MRKELTVELISQFRRTPIELFVIVKFFGGSMNGISVAAGEVSPGGISTIDVTENPYVEKFRTFVEIVKD